MAQATIPKQQLLGFVAQATTLSLGRKAKAKAKTGTPASCGAPIVIAARVDPQGTTPGAAAGGALREDAVPGRAVFTTGQSGRGIGQSAVGWTWQG